MRVTATIFRAASKPWYTTSRTPEPIAAGQCRSLREVHDWAGSM